jgi:hypothetical protein
LQTFIDSNAVSVASRLSAAAAAVYRSSFFRSTDPAVSLSGPEAAVSDLVLSAALHLEGLAVSCACVLGESLHPKKVPSPPPPPLPLPLL